MALVGGGLLLLILTLVPIGLTLIQKTWVAGIASALSLLLLVFKIVYPLPLAIVLVLLCAFVFMYVIWKKANFLFINVSDETSVAMSIEHEPIGEVKASFRNNLVKEIEDYDDNSSNDEIVGTESSLQEEEKTIDNYEMNHEILLKLEEDRESTDTIEPGIETEEDDIDSIELLSLYIGDSEEEESSEELIVLEEIEEIDFTARMVSTYEQEDEENEEDEEVKEAESYFDDFIREAEDDLQTQGEIETTGTPLLEEVSKDSTESPLENRIELIVDSVNSEPPIHVEENEKTIEECVEVDGPLILEEDLDQLLESVEEEEQIENDFESEDEVKTVEESEPHHSSKLVAAQMLTLLHEQAQHYKASGFVLEYEKIVDQILSSDLDDVMYFSIAVEYRSYLVESDQWGKVETLLSEMESRCKYPLLLEEIRFFQSKFKNKMMK